MSVDAHRGGTILKAKLHAALLAGIVGMGTVATTSAAGTVSSSRTVGAYHLVLQTGPAMHMGSMANMSGAMTVGGKPATCQSSGMNMKMSGPMCNHHVAVRVFDAKTNHVVLKAHVAIVLRNLQKHTTIAVPIAMTVGSGGLRDYQYGNNVAAASGKYTVTVTVNSVHTTFSTQLK